MKPRLAHPAQKPKRLPPSVWRAPLRRYAIAVGELLWASNRAQASFADLFSVLVDATKLEIGLAIWLSIQTDKGQITALRALVATLNSPRTRLHQNIAWAVAASEKLAEIRNDAAHMATSPTMTIKGIEFIPNPVGNAPTRLKRRSGTDFIEILSRAKGDYIQVQQYVHDIFCHLAYPNPNYPLPLRPRLLSVVIRSSRKH